MVPVVTAIRPTPAPSAEHASNWLFLPLGPVDCPELATCKPTEIAAGRTPNLLTTAAWAGDKTKLPVWIPVRFPHRDFDRLLRTDNAYGWYACVFSAPPAAGTQGLILRLGMIDDADVTYLNGVQVGATGEVVQKVSAWNVAREYRVPLGVAREENNVLLVRVLDKTGIGGILGTPAITVPLVPAGGQWQFSPLKPAVSATTANSAAPDLNALTELPGDFPSTLAGNSLTWVETALPDSGWNARLGNRPAYGVYRLSFTVEALPTGEADLVLDLGPLYDVAAVFVNGKRTGLIGRFPVPGKSAFVETAGACRCVLPRSYLRPGVNELTVVVYNEAALGGLPGIPGVLLQPEWALPSLQRELKQIELELFSGRRTAVASRLTALLTRRDLLPADSASVLSLAAYGAWLDWRDTGNADALRQALAHAAKIFVQHPDECISQSAHQALCDILRTAERTPEVAAIVRQLFPQFGKDCTYLGADRETRGDWQLNYGQRYYVLAAMGQVQDWTAGGRFPPIPYRLKIPGERDRARLWLAAVNRDVADPTALLKHGDYKVAMVDKPRLTMNEAAVSLLSGARVRRASWWDDHGETHPFDEAGPDLLLHLDLPSDELTISYCLLDFDWRDTRQPRQQSLTLFDTEGNFLNAVWCGPTGQGVYERFAVRGSRKLAARLHKNRGPCVAVAGFFVDFSAIPPAVLLGKDDTATGELPSWYSGLPELSGDMLINEARKRLSDRPARTDAAVTPAELSALILTAEAAVEVNKGVPAVAERLKGISDPLLLARVAEFLAKPPGVHPRWFYLLCARMLECSQTATQPELERNALRRFLSACKSYELHPLRAVIICHWKDRGLPSDDPTIRNAEAGLPRRTGAKGG